MSPSLQPRSVLFQFPGPVTLYPSRKSLLMSVVGCALVTTLFGIAVVTKGDGMAWFGVALFASATIGSAILLRPGALSLTLDKDGFTQISPFRTRRSRWQDVTNFHSAAFGTPFGSRYVRYTDDLRKGMFTKLHGTAYGCNAAMANDFGLSAEDLADLMTQWRNRAVRASASGERMSAAASGS